MPEQPKRPNLSIPVRSRADAIGTQADRTRGRIEIQHALKAQGKVYFSEGIHDLRPGGRFHFRYSYSTAEPLTGVGIYLVVTHRAGSGLSLNLLRARLNVRPGSGSSDPPLVVHQFDIERAPRVDDPNEAHGRSEGG